MAEVIANGLRFNVQRLIPPDPDAPVIAYVHGLVIDNLSSFYYTLANPMLKAGAEAVLYDQRGHGLSERPAEGYTPGDLAADLIGVLDGLEVHRPVHVLANSFGGVAAIKTALAYPDRVASLILVEALYGGEWIEAAANSLTLTGLGMEFGAKTEYAGNHRKLARFTHSATQLINHTTLIEDLACMDPNCADLGSVMCPVLAVYGEQSDLLEGVQEIAANMPNCELKIKPDQAHMLMMDDTEDLIGEIIEWLGLQP